MSVENTGSHLYSARRQTTLGKTFLVYILSGRVQILYIGDSDASAASSGGK